MRLILLALCLCLWACRPNSWSAHKSFPQNIWAYTDSVIIEPIIEDTSSTHSTEIKINLKENYPFRNLFIREVITTPSDSSFVRIQEFQLMNEEGVWIQKPDIFGKIEFTLPLLSGIKFREKGTWKISCKQYMRTDSLEGVEEVSWILK
jgi:gliding motility-associated lipoprotein GldH